MKSIIRHAEKTIIRITSEYPSVLVTGARRTGKTTLLKKITEQKSVPYLSFDDPAERTEF
ncbi:AAA family ATPase [Treponema porcinum]|uniref:AAA family ATPase n=1 Tax=Treponema porcinum TaxID=261392 RepID=UPI003F0AD75C